MKHATIPAAAKRTSTSACSNWIHASLFVVALMLVLGVVQPPSMQAQTFTVLYSFQSDQFGDGMWPAARVIRDSDGNLYGTTSQGGVWGCPAERGTGCGQIFKLDPGGNETVLYRFTYTPDGFEPYGGVVRDATGNLYGTTSEGGTYGFGMVYKLDPEGNLTKLHSFKLGTDGWSPYGTLFRDSAGNLYGTTYNGGDLRCSSGNTGCGTVFKVGPSGHKTVLHSFHAKSDGGYPVSGVIRDAAGNIYGTTDGGEAHCRGIVFKIEKTGKETILHCFNGGTDGSNPDTGVIRDSAGNLYGTTAVGGAFGYGTIFKIDNNNTKTILYNFAGTPDGSSPQGLTLDSAGNLYGLASFGGAYNAGTAFKLDPAGNFTVLHTFAGGTEDGANPFDRLTLDSAGNLYGTTYFGGTGDCAGQGPGSCGIVFKIVP